MATRTRPKRKTPDPIEDELEGLDELDGIDIDDLADLDLDDDDVEEVDEPEPAPQAKRSRKPKAPEPEPDADEGMSMDDLEIDDVDLSGELDLLEDEEENEPAEYAEVDEDYLDEAPEPAKPAPKAKATPKPRAPAAKADKPLSEAQETMLKDAHRLKRGAGVANAGQRRTAESLVTRKLARYVPHSDKGFIETTVAGAKHLGKPKREPVVFSAPAKTTKPAAPKAAHPLLGHPHTLPKGMYGTAQIAKAASVDENAVRRVLRLNEDRFEQVDGRWQFTKTEAQEVIREVKAYVKYTGGKRGRPAGSTAVLPEGKVGPAYLIEQSGLHRNTVYNFLRKHAEKFAKFKSAEGRYEFPQALGDKIVAKLKS